MTNSRQKGARAERELSHKLNDLGFSTRRGQQFSGANGDADVVGIPHIHIECKAVERLHLWDAMAQSINDARDGETPVVMHTKNRKPWLVTMRLEDWATMYHSAHKGDDTNG
jgi:Holliday junction resolvase